MKTLTFLLSLCFFSTLYAADTLLLKKSLFYENDLAELTPQHKMDLGELYAKIKEYNDCQIVIQGNTDVNGGDKYNVILSKKRAENAASFLVQQGVLKQNIKQSFFGEKFAEIEDNQEANIKYRRVDILVRLIRITKVSELFSATINDFSQSRLVAVDSTTLIVGKYGTKFEIPENAFVFADGKPCEGIVNFEYKEAVNPLAILSMGLSTTSDGQPLETRGMVYISATQNGQELFLDKGKEIEITLPSQKNTTEKMNLFVGEVSQNGEVNWKKDNKKVFVKDDKKIAVNIDTAMFSKIKIAEYPKPTLEKFSAMLIFPSKPVAPSMPKKPEMPDPKNYVYKPTDIEKVFFTKNKINKKSKELYAIAMSVYEKRMGFYTKKMNRYPALLAKYNTAYSQYKIDSTKYENESQKRLKLVTDYFIDIEKYTTVIQFKKYINKIKTTPITTKTKINYAVLNIQNKFLFLHSRVILESALGHDVFNKIFTEKHTNTIYLNNKYYSLMEKVNRAKNIFADSLAVACGLKESIENIQAQIMDSIEKNGQLKNYMFDGFVTTVTQLGWVNCDRFYNIPTDQKVIASIAENEDASIYLIHKNDAVFIKLSKNGNSYSSGAIPQKEPYKLIAIKVENGKPMLAIEELNTIPTMPIKLNYKTSTMSAIGRELSSIKTL